MNKPNRAKYIIGPARKNLPMCGAHAKAYLNKGVAYEKLREGSTTLCVECLKGLPAQ
jgi:hypothetical protein